MRFQILDIEVLDVECEDDDDPIECNVHLFCSTPDGTSALVRVQGFRPYFFTQFPPTWTSSHARDAFKSETYEIVRAKLFYGWEPADDTGSVTKQHLFAKRSFKSVKAFKRAGWRDNVYTFGRRVTVQNHETRVDPMLQFLDVTKMVASGWFEIPDATERVGSHARISTCAREYMVDIDSLVPLPDETAITPQIVASFDIECMSNSGGFPDANAGDPCIQIGVSWKRYMAADDTIQRVVFCLRETDDVDGADIRWFHHERDMLAAFHTYIVHELDPDIIIGYNIDGFDWKYLCDRAGNAASFCSFSRIARRHTKCEPHNFQSAAYGETTNYRMKMTGRLSVDMLDYFRRDVMLKLRSYTLDAVSAQFLGDKKNDLPYYRIFEMFGEGPTARAEIAAYCAKDCDLPLRLFENRVVLPNMTEMSRVTHVPTQFILTRGQQIKVFSQIVLVCHEMGFVVNKRDLNIDAESYQGATVVEPLAGFYKEPVTTLDFMSLYPSIMRGHNMCPSTLMISPAQAEKPPVLQPEEPPTRDAHQSAADHQAALAAHRRRAALRKQAYDVALEAYEQRLAERQRAFDENQRLHAVRTEKFQGADEYTFVQHIPGVLPEILTRLLKARADTRAKIKTTTDPIMKQILNGRQLAYKVSCNSVYGFTGVITNGMLPCLPIADAVTSVGRRMIEVTKRAVVEKYADSTIIYGDTDSVMIRFDVDHLATRDEKIRECFRLGNEAAEYVTSLFPDAVVLEMEKVYLPYLLFKKKRYAALKYEDPDEEPCIDAKGIEPARRDYCMYTCNTYNAVLNKLFEALDVDAAVDVFKQHMQRLAHARDLDVEDFVLTKSLKQNYKKPETQAHVAVVKRMRARAPGSEPRSGMRVRYVVHKSDVPGGKLVDHVDAPEYVAEQGIPLDYLYYFTNNMRKPLYKLMRLMIAEPDVLFDPVERVLRRCARQQSVLRLGHAASAASGSDIEWKPYRVVLADGLHSNNVAVRRQARLAACKPYAKPKKTRAKAKPASKTKQRSLACLGKRKKL